MGQKVHPYSLRLGIIRGWLSNWYADDKAYTQQLLEDIQIRKFIASRLLNAGIARANIERTANNVTITLHTSKPGVVIGRGGRGVDGLRVDLEKMVGQKVQVNVEEIKRPELDAQLVAENIAQQIERRISFRRAVKQSISRTMRMGAEGMRVRCAGRLGGREIAYSEIDRSPEGRVPLHTLRADVDYGLAEARTTAGRIGVKVWIYKGEILPEPKKPPVDAEVKAEGEPEVPEPPGPHAQEAAGPPATQAPEPPAQPAVQPQATEAPEPEAAEPPTEAVPPPPAPEAPQPQAAEAPPAPTDEAPAPEAPEPPAEQKPQPAMEGTPEDADATQGEVPETAPGADEGQG
jgi:small subunit ribosomal protein S3